MTEFTDALRNHMRLEAQRALAHKTFTRVGIVTNYDPAHYAARVKLLPEGIMTGYLPVTTPWVGNGWGFYAPPSIGDHVEVHFQQGGREAGFIVNRFFSTITQPLPVPSGELWVVHQSGSLLKFHNDGSVEVTAQGNMTLTSGATLRLTAPTIQVHATEEYRFDVNGHGQAWHPTLINTYQIGEVAGAAHAISPPEIGD